VSVVLSILKAVSHSTDHAILRVPGLVALSKSVRGAAISGKDGMKSRKKFAMPKNGHRCFTVSGAGHSTTAATLDSVGDQPSAEILNPKNSSCLRKSSVLEPLIRSSCSRRVSNTVVNFTKCSVGWSDSVHISRSSQYHIQYPGAI